VAPSVAVIGGGITGLVAARALTARGARVTVLEAGSRLGGQIRSVAFAGHTVDVGAEALHIAGPHVGSLLDELGLRRDLVQANPGSAWIWTGRGLRRLPAGVGPAGPTRLRPLLQARILSPRGLVRAGLEPLIPGSTRGSDVAVGAFLSRRFGRQVTDRLVDPLLGSLHAGDVHRLSLRAATPYLAAQVDQHRSLLLAQRGRSQAGAPSFVSFPQGLTRLIDALEADAGCTVRCDTRVEALTVVDTDSGCELRTASGESLAVDAAVLALPAHAAARLLAETAPEVASGLDGWRAASVVTAVVSYPAAAADAAPAMRASGLLLPSTSGRLLKAATFLTRKWPFLDDGERMLVRLSGGRAGSEEIAALDDAELVRRLHADLAEATGLGAEPLEVHVERWPRAMPQLEVGHLERLAAVRGALSARGPVVLAGAPYDGIGLAACIRSGQRAADAILTLRAPTSEAVP
jgi:oxygen-dependent protoporphyrinogen oxidase